MPSANTEAVAIAVLARAPVPGRAKTRLTPALGLEGAAALQERLTAHAVATACESKIGPVSLWTTPDVAHPSFGVLERQFPISLLQQPDGDLGARMLTATRAAGGPCLVIGSDCPAMTTEHLCRAAICLREGIDVVLIPADDGGYVLIGMREPQPLLFIDMRWSSDTVAAETRRRLARLGLSWREPARLFDIDRPEDLPRLRETAFSTQRET